MKKTIAVLIGLTMAVGAAMAQDWSIPLRCDIDTAGPVSLGDQTWQQGTTPLIALETFRRGSVQSVDTNLSAIMVIGPSATADYFAAVTNQTTTADSYRVQWPTVGTNSAGSAWWYTVYFEKDGNRYWTGSGDLYIEETTSTATDGLVWQSVTGTVLEAPIDGVVYGRKDAEWVNVEMESVDVSTDGTITGDGKAGDPLSIAAYSNQVRQAYLRGVEVETGIWEIYIGD